MSDIRLADVDARGGVGAVICAVPEPELSRLAALIDVGGCGVRGTDPHILRGYGPEPPCPDPSPSTTSSRPPTE
jgi:threonine dehydrogenase-like Zn-dependent dehydrogenase